MKDALSIVKGMRTQSEYKYSVLIQHYLSFESNFEFTLSNLEKIKSIRNHVLHGLKL